MISTEQDVLNTVASLTLIAVVALAVRQDLVEHRITNVLTVSALATGIAIHGLFGGYSGFVHALAGAGVGLACLLPLYLARGMGAGDVKLMAAAGAFLGPFSAFVAALLTLVIGAALAAVVLVWRMFEMREATAGASAGTDSATGLSRLRKERFPYALAIGIGAVATLWLRGMLDAVIAGMAGP